MTSMFIYDPLVDGDLSPVGEGKAVAGDKIDWQVNMEQVISRTYEDSTRCYLIVFAPYNASYEKNPDWYQRLGIDRCRKYLDKYSDTKILTRELLATKTHINAIVFSLADLLLFHKSDLCNKYKLDVQILPSLYDRQTALTYIIKESKNRPFVNWQDYIIKTPKATLHK